MQKLNSKMHKTINHFVTDLVIKDGVGVMETRLGPVEVHPLKKVNNSVINHDGKSRFHADTVDFGVDQTITGMLHGFQTGRSCWMLICPEDNPKKPLIIDYKYYSW